MRLMQFRAKTEPDPSIRVGALMPEDHIYELDFQGSMKDFIAACGENPGLQANVEKEISKGIPTWRLSEVRLCAPLTDPEKLIFVGLNYVDHAAESKMSVPDKPVLFAKFNNSIVGPDEPVLIPRDVRQCDYEVWIVTAEEIEDVHDLDIKLMLNGETMQNANTRDLIFNVPYLISFLSQTMTLKPGDLISTGTPSGVGLGRTPPVWLKDGDTTEAIVEGIGGLRNIYRTE